MTVERPLSALQPLAFCVMPYGTRTDLDSGERIDFDALYSEVIAPAAADAGCAVLRSDYEMAGGMVHVSMFERLLLADVVIADLSLPNPNVYYELGIRHATRPRATITMGSFSNGIPFDVAPLRHLTYVRHQGVPADAQAVRGELASRIRAGLSERAQVDSPLFSLVVGYPGIELAHDMAESYRDRVTSVLSWRSELARAVARRDREAIDALAAATQGLPELLVDAVLAYRDIEAFDMMLAVLESDPAVANSPPGIELRAFAYNRRGQPGDRDEALLLLEQLISQEGPSSERCAILGRVFKDAWVQACAESSPRAPAMLHGAIAAYRQGLEADPRDPYPGVNLVTLLRVAGLGDEAAEVAPVVAFALSRRGGLAARDYFDVAAFCELSCAIGDLDRARQAAGVALSRPHPDWAKRSTAQNLRLLAQEVPAAAELATWFDD